MTPNIMCVETPNPLIVDQTEDNTNPEIDAEYIRNAIVSALGDKYQLTVEHAVELNGDVQVHFFTTHYKIGVMYTNIDDDNAEWAGTFAFMYQAPIFEDEMVEESADTIETLIELMERRFEADIKFQARFFMQALMDVME